MAALSLVGWLIVNLDTVGWTLVILTTSLMTFDTDAAAGSTWWTGSPAEGAPTARRADRLAQASRVVARL